MKIKQLLLSMTILSFLLFMGCENLFEVEDETVEYELTIFNSSSYELWYVYITHTSSDTWGNDLLGSNETIAPGASRTFTVESSVSSIFDVQVENSVDDIYENYGVDLNIYNQMYYYDVD